MPAWQSTQLQCQQRPYFGTAHNAIQTCRSVHLTNDAVQRQYGHYNTFEDHNKLDMSLLQNMIDQQGLSISVQHQVIPQMKDAAAHVFGATLPSLNCNKLQSCFELLGLDFMVNTSGQV